MINPRDPSKVIHANERRISYKDSRVLVYGALSAAQKENIKNGQRVVWTAYDADHEMQFESFDIEPVITFANNNPEVQYIGLHTDDEGFYKRNGYYV